MNFSNSITLTTGKTKFLMPLECIVNVYEYPQKNYTAGFEDTVQTFVAIRSETFNKLGLDLFYHKHMIPTFSGLVAMAVDEEFKVVAAMIKGDRGVKVLYE